MARWDERPHCWDIDERYRGGLGMALALQGSGVAKYRCSICRNSSW